jgi:hypothetical protein
MSKIKDKSYKKIQSKKQKLNGTQKWKIKRKENVMALYCHNFQWC